MASTVVRTLVRALRALRAVVTIVLGYASRAVSAVAAALGRALRALWGAVSIILGYASRAVSAVAEALGRALRALWSVVTIVLDYVRLGVSTMAEAVGRALRALWSVVTIVFGYVRLGVSTMAEAVGRALRALWGVASIFFGYLLLAVATILRPLWRGAAAIVSAAGAGLRALWLGVAIAACYPRFGVATILRPLWRGASTIAHALRTALGAMRLRVASAGRELAAGFAALLLLAATPLLHIGRRIATAIARQLWLASSTLMSVTLSVARVVQTVASGALRYLWQRLRAAALILAWLLRAVGAGGRRVWDGGWLSARFADRIANLAVLTVWDVGRAVISAARERKGVSAMSEAMPRERVLSLIATVWVLGILGFFLVGFLRPPPPESTVVVTHWATGHLMRDGLLPEMADEFNAQGRRLQSGIRIVVEVHNVPSQLRGEWLVPRILTGTGFDLTKATEGYVVPGYGNPTIVTPSSAHWLTTVNYKRGRDVVDIAAAPSIVGDRHRHIRGDGQMPGLARTGAWLRRHPGAAGRPAGLGAVRLRQSRVGAAAPPRLHRPHHLEHRPQPAPCPLRHRGRQPPRRTHRGGRERPGCEGDPPPLDASNRGITKEGVIGVTLALRTQYPVQIFFIAIGDDADLDAGRVLAQATGAEFQGVAEEDLARVLEEFSKYF